jgi:photosystem II stability/assembly factor-like uncharacterized protein
MQSGAAVAGARAMVAPGGESAVGATARQSYNAADAGGLTAQTSGGASEGAEVLVTILSPDRSVIWIVGKNGLIRRRDAGSPGLRVQDSGVTTDLVAGAAASSSVCWVVGSGGTILRTTDGEHWAAVASPTTENLVAVSSSSAGDATVTTASSKSFATSDGGASWHEQ